MKRWILGFLFFPITLVVGVTLALLFVQPAVETIGELDESSSPLSLVSSDEFSVDETGDETALEIERFLDDKRIGRRRKNRVEIRCIENDDGTMAHIKFFSRKSSPEWKLKQSFELQKRDQLGCDPEIKDLNGDGLKDLTYRSGVAARGANEIRTLFVYDKSRDELVHVKNSDDYPNLEYNGKLKCLDAWMFHGTTTTVFLRLKDDRLEEFASVTTGVEEVVTTTGPNGNERVVSRKKMNEDNVYTRYSNFAPPTR